MKQNKFLISLIFILLINTANAAVFTVNNTSPTAGQYAFVQDAITAAVSGDTIYIAGSTSNYNNIIVNKKLVFIGPGHNPQNTNTNVAKLQTVNLNTSLATKTKFYGLEINYITNTVNNVDSIVIDRCKITDHIYINNSNNYGWLIQGNVFTSIGNNIRFASTNNINHIYIHHNILNGQLNDLSYSTYNYDVYIYNNIFLKAGTAFVNNNFNLFVFNNIFYGTDPTASTNSCAFNNNTTLGSQFGPGNFNNTDPLFVAAGAAGTSYSPANNYRLTASSPCINTGVGGDNIGVYDNTFFFNENGIPSLPQIRTFIITTPSVPAGGTLNIQFTSTIKQ